MSYMRGTITIRLDRQTEQMLNRVVRLSGRTRSEITREALRRQLSLDLLSDCADASRRLQRRRGLPTDEDVFKALS